MATMAIKHILRRSLSRGKEGSSMSPKVPKGYFAVYVGEGEKKRFVVPVSFLNEPEFQELLSMAEQEFGFDHPMGGLTIPCRQDIFINLTSRLDRTWDENDAKQFSLLKSTRNHRPRPRIDPRPIRTRSKSLHRLASNI